MKAKDFGKLEARQKAAEEQFERDLAFCRFLESESSASWRWRMSSRAQAMTWDFYFDEIDFC